MPRRIRFTEEDLRSAVAASQSYNETLRRLGLRPAGGNAQTIRKYTALWSISTEHFDPYASLRGAAGGRAPKPLESVLVKHSTYARGHLKRRLYEAGLKKPVCERCGQGEEWRGRRMSMILDHINGIGDDHRLENLQIVCPNCAATLDTHCGKQNRRRHFCEECEQEFRPNHAGQRWCSIACAAVRLTGVPKPEERKVSRPPYAQLVREIHALGWSAVGRRYGVSDNAVRKWMRQYERELNAAS